jgi:hypothetical protein
MKKKKSLMIVAVIHQKMPMARIFGKNNIFFLGEILLTGLTDVD